MSETLWKFLVMHNGSICSQADESSWQIGVWRELDLPIERCYRGFHACRRAKDAFYYVHGDSIAQVEGAGESIDGGDDKTVFQRMCIRKAWHWTATDSVQLAIATAELALPIWREQYPNNDRPDRTIAAIKAWLIDPSNEATSLVNEWLHKITDMAATLSESTRAVNALYTIAAAVRAVDDARMWGAYSSRAAACALVWASEAGVKNEAIEAAMQAIIAGLEEIPA